MLKHRNLYNNHVFSTYNNMRFGMALIATAFPLLLYLGGLIASVAFQDSMSAYYWATAKQTSCAIPGQWEMPSAFPPMRIWFVGLLFVLGIFLYLYKGFSREENCALNIAGFCALGVALFPMPWGCGTQSPIVTVHGVCAGSLFLCIAYVAIRCADDTLPLIADEKMRQHYHRTYRTLGDLMIAAPLTAFTLSLVTNNSHAVFFIEAAGIWGFAFYWWTKSVELKGMGEGLQQLFPSVSQMTANDLYTDVPPSTLKIAG